MRKIAIWTAISIPIVLLCGILPIRSQPVWFGQYLGLLFVVFSGASLFLWDFSKYLSLLSFIYLFSTFFIASLSPRSIVLLFNFNLMCLAAYYISRLDVKYRAWIKKAILGLFLIQVLWVALQAMNISIPVVFRNERIDLTFRSLLSPGKKELVGLSGSKDQSGTLFALTMPIAYSINPILTMLSIVGLYISKSSFAFVSGISSMLFYLFFTNKMHFKIAIVLVLLCSAFFFTKVDKLKWADFSTRLNVWKHSVSSVNNGRISIDVIGNVREIKRNPLLGFGFGKFQSIFPYVPQNGFNYTDEKFTHAHNDFIENHFETGYVGSVALLLLIVMFFVSFYKIRKSREAVLYASCIVAYLLNAMGNFLSQMAVSGMLLCVYYGSFMGTRRENNGNSSADC